MPDRKQKFHQGLTLSRANGRVIGERQGEINSLFRYKDLAERITVPSIPIIFEYSDLNYD